MIPTHSTGGLLKTYCNIKLEHQVKRKEYTLQSKEDVHLCLTKNWLFQDQGGPMMGYR